MRIWSAAGLIAILLLPGLAEDQHSVRMKGNDLAAHCEHFKNCERRSTCTYDDLSGFGICTGYIAGVSDAMNSTVCIPPDVEMGQVIKATIKWMDENPNLLHHDASAIVLSALKVSFQCAMQK